MRWVVLLAACLAGCKSGDTTKLPATKAELGEQLFNDLRMSEPEGQACADCHDAKMAFSDPEDDRTSAGVIRERFSARNSQTAMYAMFAPPLHKDNQTGEMVGGLFWDGRANTLEEQAGIPLLNPLEMNNPDKATVVNKAKKHYGRAFDKLYGKGSLDDVEQGFQRVGHALAEFQRTPTFAPFSSKYDRYLAGTAQLTKGESNGLAIFEDPARGNCAGCHPNRPGPDDKPPLFTNFGYANLGIPRFHDSPFLIQPKEFNPDGAAFIDRGLATTTNDPAHEGMFRTPTLRNVTRTGPYGHNGYFRRLDEMIEMITGSCMRPGSCKLAEPEVAANAQRVRSGRSLTRHEIMDLIAFLRTLEDT
jgi:cytochrome c peroxidase